MKRAMPAHNSSMAQKIYTVTLQFLMDQKPEGKKLDIDQYRGRVLRVKYDKESGKYKVDVLFNVTSMIELMAATDDQVISKTLH